VTPRTELEITPEPSPDERAAIEPAVARLLEHGSHASPWWQAGVLEATDELEAD